MQSLFKNTIESVCINDYNPQQIAVWASSAQNKEKWVHKIQTQYLLIGELESKMVGFASLEGIDYFDLLYVHADYQSKGIARVLSDLIEREAKNRRAKSIHTNVSKTAYGFFTKRNYKLVSENHFTIHDVLISNYKMYKELILY
jgi:putative acetyltransferase